MPILTIALVIILAGVLLWLAVTYIPMQPPFPTLLVAVVVILIVLWILSATGLLGQLGSVKVGD